MYNELKTLTVRNDAGVLRVSISNPPVNVLSIEGVAPCASTRHFLPWAPGATLIAPRNLS